VKTASHLGRRIALLAALLGALSLVAATAAAQAPPGPVQTRPGAPPQARPADEQDRAQIRVRVELVTTPVTVRNSSGELVYDLSPADFRIFDNGVEQKIEEFDMGGDPLSLVVVFQTSSRIAPFLPRLRETGVLFSQAVLGQTGETAILGFHDRVETLLEFTNDAEAIDKTIAKLPEGTSGARLYDALSAAVGKLRTRPGTRRRVIIVISEAVDTGSENKLSSVLREAQLEQITIYTVGISTVAALLRSEPQQTGLSRPFPPGTLPTPGIPGRPQTPSTEQAVQRVDILKAVELLIRSAADVATDNPLEMASAATGGMHTGTIRERAIEAALDKISGELHAQYTLTYRPANVTSGGYHEIRVTVARAGVSVRARPGYYVAPEAAAGSDGPKP